MPRNGSGSMSTPNTFVPGTTITASDHNENWTDNAAEMTNSLALDGQSTMTGPIKASNGTVAAPAITFGSDPDTGISRIDANTMAFSANGAQVMQVDPTGAEVTGDMTVSGALDVGGTGWLETASIADKAVTYVKMQRPSAASRILASSAVAGKSITGAANNGSGAIRLTVADTSDLTTGQKKSVTDVAGTTEANGTWTITVVSGTTVDLQGSTFANAYVSGGTLGGSVEEISLGSGLKISNAGVLKVGFGAPGTYSNKVIKVATTTTVDVSCDWIVTTDGTNVRTTALSATINLGTTGANALDAGVIQIDKWYALYAITKDDGTTAGLASLSFTSPTLPSGYTAMAYLGAVPTIHATATLYGIWQHNSVAAYKVGLAGTTTTRIMSSVGSATGTITVAGGMVAVTARGDTYAVPPSAYAIEGFIAGSASSTIYVQAGPNNNFGAYTSTTNPAPNVLYVPSVNTTFTSRFFYLLESDSVYWATSNAGIYACTGWRDA